MDCFRFVLFPLNPIIPEIYTHRLVFLAVKFFWEERNRETHALKLRTYLSQEVPNELTNSCQFITRPRKLFSLSVKEMRLRDSGS